MFRYIKWMFGRNKTNYAQLVKDGALILDVRNNDEYKRGHIRDSVNIPVDQLNRNLNRFTDKNRPIITCCASGIRSASAKTILNSNGFSEVYNGGSWNKLQTALQGLQV